MASIYQRNGTYWISYSVGGRRVQRSLKTRNRRIAEQKKEQLDALKKLNLLPEATRTPVTETLQAYCEYIVATQSAKGAKNDRSYLRQFFGPCCPALEFGSHVNRRHRDNPRSLPTIPDRFKNLHVPVKHLEDISSELIAEFIRERIVRDGIKPRTANRIREVLSRLFNFAADHKGYVCPDRRYRNPAAGVRRQKVAAPQITWLTTEAITKQLQALESNLLLQAMVATYIYAGLRREEALWLTPEDVDLDARLIRVRAKTVAGQSWQPKTKRNRAVPISKALLPYLQQHALRRDKRFTWFFTAPAGGRWDPDNFSQDLKALNEKAGLSWSCLDYRHTFGSLLAQKGESLYKIAELMGNSPEICRRHYAALVPEKMHDVVEFGSASDAENESQERRQPGPTDRPPLRLVR